MLVDLLLQYGARINERQLLGQTTLHSACAISIDPKILSQLLRNGADLKSFDDHGETPLTYANFGHIPLIKELARLKFDHQYICRENLEFLELNGGIYRNAFEECLTELQKMKDCWISNGLSMYDIYSMRKKNKMTCLAVNENFIDRFDYMVKQFKHYGDGLDETIRVAALRGYAVEKSYKSMYAILKYHLPELIIRKINYYLCEDEIFDEYYIVNPST